MKILAASLPKLSSISAYSKSELKRFCAVRLDLAGSHGGLWLGRVSLSVTLNDRETQKLAGTCSGSGKSSRSCALKVINVSGSGTKPVLIWNWQILRPCGRTIPLRALRAWYSTIVRSPQTVKLMGNTILPGPARCRLQKRQNLSKETTIADLKSTYRIFS